MIKVRLKSLEENKDPIELELIPGEILTSAIDRALEGLVDKSVNKKEFFVVLVNGLVTIPEYWEFIKLKEGDKVFIAPKISGGGGNSLLRAIFVIAATVFLGPAGGPLGQLLGVTANTMGAGLLAAGVSIVASLVAFALFPPPTPEVTDNGRGDTSSSQMYSINGQANQVKRYGTVPKVYGTHRMYPLLAASPYTELEADPATGNLVQYFYAIYDFGLGPMDVRELKIGDTPLESFTDVSYRLVDFNKPDISEGDWDDLTVKELAFYKGDVSRLSIGVAINSDEGPSVPVGDYRVERTCAPNTLNDVQEIIVTMANPQGLYALSPTGERGKRIIDLVIEFSKVGENIWKSFNDVTQVSSHTSVGGSDAYASIPINLYPPGATSGGIYPQTQPSIPSAVVQIGDPEGGAGFAKTSYYGLLKDATQIVLADSPSLIGKYLFLNGELIGKILSGAFHSSGYTTYTFDTPLNRNITLFSFYQIGEVDDFVLSEEEAAKSNVSVGNKAGYGTLIDGKARIERSETGTIYSSFKFTPIEIASYKVRITRKSSSSEFSSQIIDDLSWVSLDSRFDRQPIQTSKRHVFMDIKIKATNQLNGSIQNLNAICSSVLPVWNGDEWVKEISANPAWVFVDLLTGEVNKRAIDFSRLDIASIIEWSEFCDEVPDSPPEDTFTYSRFNSNFVLDFSPTLQSIINQVTSAGQASLNIIDGKYGILIDKFKEIPVQIFTPRNSSGFNSTRNYVKRPHALKITYIDPAANWEPRETIVYDTGYSEENATEFDEATTFACTNPQQAWRFGRYLLAQNRLRQETIQIRVDFENLVCTRGDFVQITQDVMKVGGSPARVKSVDGNTITIDDAIETIDDDYGYVFRSITGEILTSTLTIISDDTFELDGDLPQVGDLIVIGVMGSIVMDCIVKSIDPLDEFSANMTLVEKADAIFSAESTDSLPEYSPQIASTSGDFAPPKQVPNFEVVDSYYECNSSGGLDYFVSLNWDVPTGNAYEIFEVWVDSGRGYNLIANTKESLFLYQASRANLGLVHKFKVIAVSATGRKLDIGAVEEVTQLISAKTDLPPDIEVFNADITGEVLQLYWTRLTDCSCQEYLIRYSPTTTGTWERSIPLLRVDKNTSLASVQARTGTYLIKAVDVEGNESNKAKAIITTIPNLFNLNVIEELTDDPDWLGSKDRVEVDTGALTIVKSVFGGVDEVEFYPEGFYYYYNLLDLGDIYSVRIQSLIQAEGFTFEDLMSNWPDLDSLDAMSHAGASDWDVETHYRTTEQLNVMSEWESLDLIDPISEGSQEIWSEWRKVTIGDCTGRIFQFRLKLISNKVSVTPRVFNGTIKADMTDRVESYENQVADSIEGKEILYSPAFKGPGTTPNVQITIDSASSGDYWTFDYKSLNGFKIFFFDKDDNPVERTFDAAIKGFGRKATEII